MRLDFGRDLVTRSGRYLVAGSQVPGGGLGRRRERAKEGGGGVSSGRQAADNNQAWTAGRRIAG